MEFKKMVKKIILCVILIILSFSLVSCQTIEGLGGDIKWTAQKGAEILGGKRVEEGRY
jgi:predicted small secreted protein